MALVDNSKTPAVQMATMVPALTGTYMYLVAQITQLGRRVYGTGKDSGGTDSATAIANVQAMGVNADAIFTMAGTFEAAINAVAPLLGKQPITVMPAGYTYTSNASDGSGVLTYTAPASSSSSSSSSSSASA